MDKKTVLGIDLGSNSIGWALVERNSNHSDGQILGIGSRIIPMSQDILGDFEKGNSVSQTSARTSYRSVRRLRERHLLRRERLHRVLNRMDFLPEHYSDQIDFDERLGQFKKGKEPKIAWVEISNDKYDFYFKKSFNEMLDDFKKNQPEFFERKNRHGESPKIPYDWTIYYLRKKALHEKIQKEELAWLLLHFNQKRGYYQQRGEELDEVATNKLVEIHTLRVVDVVADEQPAKQGAQWYSMHLENGWVYRRSSKIDLQNWKGKVRDFVVTTELNSDGSVKRDKEGNEKRTFRSPGEDDWTLVKKKTEKEIEQSNKSVGAYIYDTLLANPRQKIRGKLIRTIERKYYRDELSAILRKQIELQPAFFTPEVFNDVVRELYPRNEAHRTSLLQSDFVHLFVNDIIFYQRPLKSKKSTIGKCTLESRKYWMKDCEGQEVEKIEYLRSIAKSHPLFQEFRVWQFLSNLKILLKEDNSDVTEKFLKTIDDRERLFEFLMSQKEVEHKKLLKFLLGSSELKGKPLNAEIAKYRWNYVYDQEKDESKVYPCNETGYEIRRRLESVIDLPQKKLTASTEINLWHIIYSVSDRLDYEKALRTFAEKNQLHVESFVESFKTIKPFDSDYASFSEKAIKRLLPLMRLGKYWNWDDIDDRTKGRIDKLLTGEVDEKIRSRVREKSVHLAKESDFQGLPIWLAQYVVYDRHSEAMDMNSWKTPNDISDFLSDFRQHSLRNPIVEQVVTETLRVVHDVWVTYGKGKANYFDEIHVELGRDMKNSAEERKNITHRITENENTNLRIKALIRELKANSDGGLDVRGVRPYSPVQQQALKIYEEGVLNSGVEVPDDIAKISKSPQPTRSELIRYKLWLEQKYRSPYTGMIIPLSKLFTEDYQIEHIIPQSRYFDDSFSNKVICESAVNQLKANLMGQEFIQKHQGEVVETGNGKNVRIFTMDEYLDFVKLNYKKNPSKRTKLLLEEIPEKMIERQLNDTRYISKYVSKLLSNLVREEKDDEGVTSKNFVPVHGKITSRLRNDWGLNDVWNALVLPRFQRMNLLTDSDDFVAKNTNGKLIPRVPHEFSKGFQKKRIDHRHHALDALVIACLTRSHVNLLNNMHANSKQRFDLSRKLRHYEKVQYADKATGKLVTKDVPKHFISPWPSFASDAQLELERMVVSFKQNLRVINKTTNYYQSYKDENGNLRKDSNGLPKKAYIPQVKGDSWAIRKPLHKDTVSGKVDLPHVKVPKGKILTATRKNVDTTFNEKKIDSITDTGIQKILKNYLNYKGGDPEVAFTPEGLEEMNKEISTFNDGRWHQPITKVRIYEVGNKFPLGQDANKKTKYVEAAKGTNLFFAIYQGKNGQRSYDTIPLNVVVERQKQGLSSVPELNEKGDRLLFHLSPNDLVYVPEENEEHPVVEDFNEITAHRASRIYKMVSSSGSQCFFIAQYVASSIVNKKEFSALNKMERSVDGIMIKSSCIKLKSNRLGHLNLLRID